MGTAGPPDFAAVVRRNWRRTLGYLMASSSRGAELRERTLRTIDRRLESISLEGLSDLGPGGSWLLAVIIGPGDTLAGVAAWAASRPSLDVARVRFYLLPGSRLVHAFAPWYDAGLPDPLTANVRDWPSFHKQFGADLNNQVYRDAKTHPEWFE